MTSVRNRATMLSSQWLNYRDRLIARSEARDTLGQPESLTAFYDVQGMAAAENLASWFRMYTSYAPTVGQDGHQWRVSIKAPAIKLTRAMIEAWFLMLSNAPQSDKWELTGMGMGGP